MQPDDQRLGIDYQVIFIGPSDRVADYFKAADFGILPSEFEGISNALLEAMACGLSMIGSRISGTTDLIIDGESGWLFEPHDVDHLAPYLS